MNKQDKGDGRRGIEWTDYSFNPIAGCFHGCQWDIDGQVANCYAEDAAENSQAVKFYPHGFEHHYWHPDRLNEPLSVRKPSKIFVGSMADVFGHWVPASQIEAVLDICRRAHWHMFQFLTKNPVRAKQFTLPANCWLGASTPPDHMWGKPLSEQQKRRMLEVTLEALGQRSSPPVAWLSAEPLSWDITPILENYSNVLQWMVIGAASKGSTYYQPEPAHLRRLIGFLDDCGCPIFMKGNLRPSLKVAFDEWREQYPDRVMQGSMF